MKNKALITTISIASIFIFLFVVYYLINGSNNQVYKDATTMKPGDRIKWASKSKNLLVEYSDFECSACKVFHTELKKLEASDSANIDIVKNITFVYRHFPLTQHPNAIPSAQAAEAAGRQNKFFEMSDLLFDTQDEWASLQKSGDYFLNLAKKLNLNLDKFKKDYSSQDIRNKIQDDLKSGENLNVDATPTFFLNGKKIEIGSVQDFEKILTETAKNK